LKTLDVVDKRAHVPYRERVREGVPHTGKLDRCVSHRSHPSYASSGNRRQAFAGRIRLMVGVARRKETQEGRKRRRGIPTVRQERRTALMARRYSRTGCGFIFRYAALAWLARVPWRSAQSCPILVSYSCHLALAIDRRFIALHTLRPTTRVFWVPAARLRDVRGKELARRRLLMALQLLVLD
jgi:hypothetical protein